MSLVRTKLFAPILRPDVVARPALVARLAEGLRLRRRLSAIIAPAGFGKTTLLMSWLAGERSSSATPRPFAWLTLDEADGDPATFARYLAAALELARPEVMRPIAALLESGKPMALPDTCVALINAFAALPADTAPAVLVLDDYHTITAPAIHQALGFLIDHLPPQLHLVLLAREDPPLPLPRLRARGELTELRAADLRFSADEAADLLRAVTQLPLSDPQVAALHARTEGWPAGLQLAALSLRGRADPGPALAALAADDRFVLDYLLEEVFARQPEPVRAFWMATAVLDRMCADLCDVLVRAAGAAAVDPPPAQAMLERLERQNLFLAPLDERRGWYRYHPLFASLLRSRLAREAPAAAAALHRAASAWFASHGLGAEAIQHALAAGDVETAADLIAKAATGWLARNEVAALCAQVERLPAEVTRARAPLALAYAQGLVSTGRLGEAAALLDAIDPQQLDLERQLARMGAQIVIAGARADTAAVAALASALLPLLPPEETGIRGLVAFSAGLAASLHGDVATAIPQCERAAVLLEAGGRLTVALVALQTLAGLRVSAGELRAAADACRQALELGALPGGDLISAAGPALLVLSDLHYEWDELAEAERLGRRALELCRRWGHPGALAECLAALARVRHARGDAMEAAGLLAEASAVIHGLAETLPGVTRVWLTRLQLSPGIGPDLPGSERWRRATLPSAVAGSRRLALARAQIATGAAREPLLDLAELRATAMAAGRCGPAIEAGALEALAWLTLGEPDRAAALLGEALALAASRGYVRLFVDLGEPFRQLGAEALRRWGDQHPSRPYLRRLLAALGGTAEPAADGPPDERLLEALSEREIEVLRLVAAGLSNTAIAERLILAPGTVKRHLHNIYGKLGVDDRLQAVNRGRELGLL